MNPENRYNHEGSADYKIDEEKKSAPEHAQVFSDRPSDSQIESAHEKTIESQANYQGWWDDALKSRLSNDAIKAQFISQRLKHSESLPEKDTREQNYLNKPIETQETYMQSINNYESRLENAFSEAGYLLSTDPGSKGKNKLGFAKFNEYAVLIKDAEKDGAPFTERQKNIIFTHEVGHRMRTYKSSDRDEIVKSLHFTQDTPHRKYLQNPDEIIERMAQLKNYYGMEGNETFTKEHLDYAKQHYVADTALDNNMTDFFNCVTSETEDQFLKIINEFGV